MAASSQGADALGPLSRGVRGGDVNPPQTLGGMLGFQGTDADGTARSGQTPERKERQLHDHMIGEAGFQDHRRMSEACAAAAE